MMLPVVVLLLPVACSISQFMPAPGVLSEDNYAIIRSDSLLIIVRPQNYPGSYQEVNNRFFPVFISIKNTSDHKIQIKQNSFSILCNEKQYDPIPTDYILADLERRIMLNEINSPFTSTSEFSLTDRNKEKDMYYELVNNEFSYGELLPNGKKEGYLFYNRDIASAKSFTIDILGNTIPFIR